jgi:peptidoglycan/xylan/chitin deacetylase (PgdA/CDA1 family)
MESLGNFPARTGSGGVEETSPGSGGLRVALTFDAEHPGRSLCPPGNAERILVSLREAEARASFFIQGRWAASYPEDSARMAADGHLIGNHSHYHAPLPFLSDEGLRTDVRAAEERIVQITGTDPRPWFRCPFGAGRDDPRVLSTLQELGYRNVGWHVELEDWEPSRSTAAIADGAVDGVLAHGDGAVVLLHTWPVHTAEALPAILARLQETGARFVPVDQVEVPP